MAQAVRQNVSYFDSSCALYTVKECIRKFNAPSRTSRSDPRLGLGNVITDSTEVFQFTNTHLQVATKILPKNSGWETYSTFENVTLKVPRAFPIRCHGAWATIVAPGEIHEEVSVSIRR